MRKTILTLCAAVVIPLSGCAVNAVTGERNLQLMGSDWLSGVDNA